MLGPFYSLLYKCVNSEITFLQLFSVSHFEVYIVYVYIEDRVSLL